MVSFAETMQQIADKFSANPKLFDVIGDVGANISGIMLGNDAAGQVQDANYDIADIYKRAYDEQLAELLSGADQQGDIFREDLNSSGQLLRGAADQYGEDVRGAYTKYADFMYPEFEKYATNMADSSNMYSDQYEPYIETGQQALQRLEQIAQQDPNKLTPAQRLQMKDLQRQFVGNLASSGLRGAGRAGVAATNDAIARQAARSFDANQARSDAATTKLNEMGFSSTGKVADNRYATGKNISDTGFNLAGNVGSKIASGEGQVAAANYATNKGIADRTSDYYKNVAGLTGTTANLKGNNAVNKANATAGAVGANAAVGGAQTASNNNMFGTIASAVNQGLKTILSKQSETPWFNPDLQ